MQKITAYLLFIALVSCKQITYSEYDPTPSASLGISTHTPAEYKSSVIFTTEVDYYEPVFDY